MNNPQGGWSPNPGNVAQDGSTVGQQNAVNYGETTIHHTSTYHVNKGDPPQRRYEVARNFLEAGVSRMAEPLFEALLREDYRTTECAYYYVLSVLSGRSFGDVDSDLFRKVHEARKIAQSLPHDEWQRALALVWRLMRVVRTEVEGEHHRDDTRPVPRDDLEDVLAEFGALRPERQDEINQHLSSIQRGVMQAKLNTAYAHRVVSQRMSGNRVARAWKFFEAEPARPRRFEAADTPAEKKAWNHAVAGWLVVLLGVFGSFSGAPAGVLLALPLVLGGGILLIHHGGRRDGATLWAQLRSSQISPGQNQPEARSPGHWVQSDFVKEVHRIVDSRFSDARPHVAGDWPTYTSGVRAYLKRRLVELYGNARVQASEVSWLAWWHARQVAKGWNTSDLTRIDIRPAARDVLLFRVGVGLAIAGLVVLIAAGAGGAAVVIAIAGYFAAKGSKRILGLKAMSTHARAFDDQLFAEENQGYEEWVRLLADRPSDSEMARWLAMDKIYLKNDLVRRNHLTAHDLVTDVVMNEGADGAKRARVLHGPPRYSKYEVQIFLLTQSGVREIRLDLDFLTGDARNERRTVFPYQSLAHARMVESGFRATRGEGDGVREVERLRGHKFCLTLVTSQEITVIAENFRSADDAVIEDDTELFLVALQTSGIDSGLRVLETVAAEGSDWIARDKARRAQWVQDFYE
ncbi:hypothetical protein JNUCC0626_20595 [Lentzea sp. JNUCC 0626]|uniref:hypothetical protein n=1 Tax=Lentzea sp. JNUCC 0626 TaxID=3367513 RepID=UPI0037489A73